MENYDAGAGDCGADASVHFIIVLFSIRFFNCLLCRLFVNVAFIFIFVLKF